MIPSSIYRDLLKPAPYRLAIIDDTPIQEPQTQVSKHVKQIKEVSKPTRKENKPTRKENKPTMKENKPTKIPTATASRAPTTPGTTDAILDSLISDLRASSPTVTIESIVENIPLTLRVLTDKNGIVHDTSTVALICARKHIHRYFIRDICDAPATLKCPTCASGGKFMIALRELVEDCLGVPFVLTEPDKRRDTTVSSNEYHNPMIGIVIACIRDRGEDCISELRGTSILKIYRTTSVNKLKRTLQKLLTHPTLTDRQRTNIAAMVPSARLSLNQSERGLNGSQFIKIHHGRSAAKQPRSATTPPPRRRNTYIRDKLPYSSELANNSSIYGQQTSDSIVVLANSDTLCLENCVLDMFTEDGERNFT